MTASQQQLPIRFSRPTAKKIWIKVSGVKKGTDYAGDDAVKHALLGYIGSSTAGGLGIGQNVIYIKLPGIVAAVSGVEDFDIDISTDGSTYSKTNIEIGYREKAITEESAVIIE